VLTAEDITNRKFEKAAFGYKAEEVEIFLKDVALAVSKLEEEKDVPRKSWRFWPRSWRSTAPTKTASAPF
jgi:DivIVA domain-containing protein